MKTIYFIRRNKTKFGGAENYLSRLTNTLIEKQINYQVLHGNFPKWLPTWIKALLFNLYVSFKKRNKFYFSLERISKPDVYRAGDGVHKVYIKVKKSKFNPTNFVYCYLEKRCFNNAKLIIANSHFIKRQIIQTYQIDKRKIKVIYNGINLKPVDHYSSKLSVLKELPIIENKKIILFVGSDFYRKGVDILLKIISKLQSDNFHVIIIGKDKKAKAFQKLAETLNINNQISFTGLRADVNHFYAISDIFLFPTRYEPFSNVVLEAMNTSNVTFTSNQNGASEILPNDYIITDSNHEIIAKKIDNLLNDHVLLYKEKQKNHQIAKSFTIEKNAEETINAILPLLD
ncbi:glycosyltransferase family 4 protein [Thiotrichales bacterium 19S11-10]|nr:glycosyltransferase family 4 protein [Thiotrichales bacterium 19S11-10]